MTRMLVLVINPGMMLVPRVLPTVSQDQPYSVTLEVLDEQPPVKLRIVAGTLPTGLTFVDNGDGTATISGTTSAAEGFFDITVEFEDVRQDPRQHTYRMQVVVVPVPLVPIVVSGIAPDGEVGVPYTYTFTATGGTGGPYTWGIASGTLPPGITLNSSTGEISGTPTTDTGSPFGFSVYATDNDGNFGAGSAQSVSITLSVAATWDPLHKSTTCALSIGDTRATQNGTGGTYVCTRSNIAITGKRYFRVRLNHDASGAVIGAGVADAGVSLNDVSAWVGSAESVALWGPNGSVYKGGSVIASSGAWVNNPLYVDIAVDATTRAVWLRRNGISWIGGGDPETGASPTATLGGSGALYAGCTASNFSMSRIMDIISAPADCTGGPAGFAPGLTT